MSVDPTYSVRLGWHATDLDADGHLPAAAVPYDNTTSGSPEDNVQDELDRLEAGVAGATRTGGFDGTPALSIALPAWMKPTGSGQITIDPQGRVSIDTGSGYKSFPGMAFLEGRLHLVYRDGAGHNGTGGVIKYRFSDTLGRAWSAATAIATPPAGAHDYRDPSILALSSGRLLVGYDTSTGVGGAGHATGLYTMFSDNRGQSWSSPFLIPSTDTNQGNGTCPALELPDGRVLLPGYVDPASLGHYTSVFWASTDDGATFSGSYTTIAAYGARDYNETKLLYIASGLVVAFMRSETNHHTWRSTSADLGATWSAATDVNSMTGRPDVIEFYPGALMQQGRYLTSGDSPLYYATSWDAGATWTTPEEVDVGGTALGMYSAPVLLAPGYVAIAYSLENSSGDADLFMRWYFDGYGTDVLGQIRARFVMVDEQAAPATPPSGKGVWYAGTDSKPHFKADTGTDYDLSAGGMANPMTTEGDLIYEHSGAATRLPIGAVGRPLVSDGSDPVYTAAGGDVTGAYSALTVGKVQGRAVENAAPADGQVMRWDAGTSQWRPSTLASASVTVHDESLTDGASNFIFAGGDIVTVVGVPNP